MTTVAPAVVDAVSVSVGLAGLSFVDAPLDVGGSPISTSSPKETRASLNHAQISFLCTALAGVEAHHIPVHQGEEVSITVILTTGCTGTLPAVVYVNSGDWIIGNFGTHDALAPERSADTSTGIVFVTDVPSPVDAVLTQQSALPEALNEAPEATSTLGPVGRLSPREQEVLALVAQGQTNKQIAEALFVAPSTIKTHVTSLLTKLDATTRTHLATIAARRGLLPG